MTRRFWPVGIGAAVVALYLLRLDAAAGLYVDDAWYMVLAKALAQGDGFALISSAAEPILPAFPPGFPLLLAPVFAIQPQFPDNVLWLKTISIAAMVGVGVATYLYLSRVYAANRFEAAAVAVLTMVTPAFVFLATSTVMAECAFTLGQLAMALMVERVAKGASRSRLDVVVAAALGTATLLIRTAGIAPLAAGALYLAMRRGWRFAAGFAAVAALCYLPWALYAQAHRPTDEARLAHGGSVAYVYADLLAMRHGGDAVSGRIGLADLPGRIGANLVSVFGRDIGAVIFPAAYRGPSESGQEAFALSGETGLRAGSMGGGTLTVAVSFVISAITLAGFVSAWRRGPALPELLVPLTVAMVVLVPARTFRYVLPLTPFIVYYALSGVRVIAAWLRQSALPDSGSGVRIAVLCMLVLAGLEHGQYIWMARRGPHPEWLRDYQEVKAVGDWMNSHLAAEGAVTSTNPGLVYLVTGRKAVALTDPEANRRRWQALGVRYAVAMHVTGPLPQRFGRVLYRSPRLGLWVLELSPASASLTESASQP